MRVLRENLILRLSFEILIRKFKQLSMSQMKTLSLKSNDTKVINTNFKYFPSFPLVFYFLQ